jgi:hypothetical protein
VRHEIPVTSPFRTIFDLAAILKMRPLERALHEAEVSGLTDRVSLPMLLERYPGRRGTRNLQALLESPEPVGLTQNDFEEAFLALVGAHGISRPRMNGRDHRGSAGGAWAGPSPTPTRQVGVDDGPVVAASGGGTAERLPFL